MRKKVLVPKCNLNSLCVLNWRRKKVGHEIFLRVSELCNGSLKKESECSERGKMVKTMRKTGKLIKIATVKAGSAASAC